MIKGEVEGVEFEVAESSHEAWWTRQLKSLKEEKVKLECQAELVNDMISAVEKKIKVVEVK